MSEAPFNPSEQRDMNEFFIDLIDKLEHVSPELVSTCESILQYLCTPLTKTIIAVSE